MLNNYKNMEKIKENNILLAEFLGWENLDKTCLNVGEDTFIIDSNLVYDRSYLNLELEDGSSVCTMCAEYLKFNSDWNWLMLVADKIGKIENFLYPNGLYKYLVQFKIEVGIECVSIVDVYGEGLITIKHYEGSLIENIYNACVEFVKWYNNHTLKNIAN